MCGLVGYAGLEGGPPAATRATSLKLMTETLACRGPDASGRWEQDGAGLGHTRLATLDPAGGHQPLLIERDGHCVLAVVFVGEIYNHREIRAQLAALGHRFRDRSDSEVVLRAVDAWGPRAPARLEGMFAYAAWEPEARRLTLARDRLGIKPLCYTRLPDGVVFGSEPKAVLAHPAVPTRVDRDGLRELLLDSHPMIKTPGRSVYAGLREVAPGTVTTITPAGERTERYWSLSPAEHRDSLPDTVATIRALLGQAVRAQFRADVPVCALLSGGLDSSAIAAIARAGGENISTLSVDLGGPERGRDRMRRDADRPYVELMVRHLRTRHRSIAPDPADLADPSHRTLICRLRDGLGLGDFDTSLLLLFRAVRERFPVTVSGEGADELFGGYRWSAGDRVTQGHFPWENVLADADVTRLLDPALAASLELPAYRAHLYESAVAELEHPPGIPAHERAPRLCGYLNLTRFLPCLLDRTDRLSMGLGLEVRVPFLDHRLVEYVFNIPWAMKTFDGREKSLLRAAVADLLPARVLARYKSPYPMTRDPGYRAALTAQVAALLDRPGPALDLLDPPAVRRLLLDPPHGRDRFPREGLEFVLDLDQWLRIYRPALSL
ncbi:MAG TPA: asparagine synthase (glutamine-hydrolyzing) [Actinocrinis sp.]|jgi:asparagine synthase (glutamine-hydrolysing)|uniref:asparagine synthase (glutamine-hydrolyzing) n=1 Tax=Actinocrinis sp. TaxID=1920516 RepID=UPI002DDD0473|nr:asparagine synthase (glutamine-hydrolyzing) [Actinocrinis sp.]HEV3172218.1 asparagine synthase (glutamine-hydrolyzing) [Actinocrinis sp.]